MAQRNSLITLFSNIDSIANNRRIVIDMINGGVETIYENLLTYNSIKSNGFTLEKCILRHGSPQKFNEYSKFQGDKNLVENLGIKEYTRRNKLRAVTLENQISKYGLSEGTKRYNKYVETQRIAGSSLSYFIEKYGKIEGTKMYKNVNDRKAQSLENFIIRYGDVIGTEKYISYCEGNNIGYSNKSQIMFDMIYEKLNDIDKSKCYYGKLNREFGKLNQKEKCYYRYDFTLTNKKIIIEYNGDHYHANPEIYNSGDIVSKKRGGETLADDIWAHDKTKIDLVVNQGFNVLIVWDSHFDENPQHEIDRIMKVINEY